MDAYVSAARKVVEEGAERSGVPLSPVLHEHLSMAVSRLFVSRERMEMMTVRYFAAVESGGKRSEIRAIGDGCLVACGMFPERVVKAGGSIPHYEGLGKSAYDELGMVEAVYGWDLMTTVLSSLMTGRSADSLIRLAMSGAKGVVRELSGSNVVIFPGARKG